VADLVSECLDMLGQQDVEKLAATDEFGYLNIELIDSQSFGVDQPKLVED
jgi:hypothetical protein